MKNLLRSVLLSLILMPVLVVAVAVVLRLMNPLPDISNRQIDNHSAKLPQSRLDSLVSGEAARHPGKSGVYGLLSSQEAFASRYLLINAADSTIDMQYYIWHRDISGLLLLDAVRQAADRGVHVRLLIDDLGTTELDSELYALDAHADIEVRLFNPRAIRKPSFFNYITDFTRINRRMHNKSMIVDHAATIIGGRNIGDEYFGAGDGEVFVDMDVLATGAVVSEVSANFNSYFNSASSYAAADILPVSPDGLNRLKNEVASVSKGSAANAFYDSLARTEIVEKLAAGQLELEWTEAKLVSDNPSKGLGTAPESDLLVRRLPELLGNPKVSVNLVSPYFVPGELGTRKLLDIAETGVQVRVLTNAQVTTDVALVHSGYASYRRDLLAGRVALYELKPVNHITKTDGAWSLPNPSAASLHAKTFAVDGKRIFIGSFNFDPRSANLNCEMGLLIESHALGGRMNQLFETELATYAYQLELTQDGSINWLEKTKGGSHRFVTEPHTTWAERVFVRLVGYLPIEWML